MGRIPKVYKHVLKGNEIYRLCTDLYYEQERA